MKKGGGGVREIEKNEKGGGGGVRERAEHRQHHYIPSLAPFLRKQTITAVLRHAMARSRALIPLRSVCSI